MDNTNKIDNIIIGHRYEDIVAAAEELANEDPTYKIKKENHHVLIRNKSLTIQIDKDLELDWWNSESYTHEHATHGSRSSKTSKINSINT